jgi:hypothetical protein
MIYTSYFAGKRYANEQVISIARKTPVNINIPIYIDLAPSFELITDYKRYYDQSRYVLRYAIEVLSKLDPFKVIQDLDDKVMLCYEKPGSFCHRHIVAKWLNVYTGIDVVEL